MTFYRGTSKESYQSYLQKARRKWSKIFKVFKEKKKNKHQPGFLSSAQLFFKIEGEIKIFLNRNWVNLLPVALPYKKW